MIPRPPFDPLRPTKRGRHHSGAPAKRITEADVRQAVATFIAGGGTITRSTSQPAAQSLVGQGRLSEIAGYDDDAKALWVGGLANIQEER